jgi:hypothetical protein
MNNLLTEAIWEHPDEILKNTFVIRSKLERVECKNRKGSQDPEGQVLKRSLNLFCFLKGVT